MKKVFMLLVASLLGSALRALSGNPNGWWPEQKAPRQIVTCTIKHT